MKKFLVVILAIGMLGAGFYLRNAKAIQIDFAWDYDYTVDPACSATLPVNCVSGFEISDAQGLLQTVSNPPECPPGVITNCINPNGLSVGIAASAIKGPPYGQQTFSLVAVGVDGSGVLIKSASSSVVATITPGRPQNVRFP